MYDDTKVTFVIPNEEMDSSMLDEKTDSSRLTRIVVASNNNMLEDKPISNTDTDIGGMYRLEQCYKISSILCM